MGSRNQNGNKDANTINIGLSAYLAVLRPE